MGSPFQSIKEALKGAASITPIILPLSKDIKLNARRKDKREAHLFVSVQIWYKGKLATFEMLVDTGATVTVIDNDHAAQLEIPKTAGRAVKSDTAGGKIPGRVMGIDYLLDSKYYINETIVINSQVLGEGLLGMNILEPEGAAALSINYREETVTIRKIRRRRPQPPRYECPVCGKLHSDPDGAHS